MDIILEQILENLFALNNLKVTAVINKKEKIIEFIKSTINGDKIKTYLAINAHVKPKVLGALLYVLTNVRLIKIEIDKEGSISSSSFFLDKMVSVDRKLIGDNISSIDVIFQNTSIGLRYPISDTKITDFFQTIEQLKAERDDVNT